MGRFTDNSVKDAAQSNSAKTAGVLSLAALAGVALLSVFREDRGVPRAEADDLLPREVLISTRNVQEQGVQPEQNAPREAEQEAPQENRETTIAAPFRAFPLLPTEPSVKLAQETSVMLVGGGVIPPEVASLIAARCSQLSKLPNGGDGTLLICSYATSDPLEGFARAQRIFSTAGATNISYLPLPEDPDFSFEVWKGFIENASGIFFTGGDQKRIYSRLFNRNLLPELHARFESGPCILGGTSAGTAIMSPTMIAGGPLVEPSDWPELFLHKTDFATFSHGISVVPFITDQHFSQKRREERLSRAVEVLGQAGIGVDENTAVHYVEGQFLDVYGEGGVTIIFPTGEKGGEIEKKIAAGGRFDLREKRVSQPPATSNTVALVSEIGE